MSRAIVVNMGYLDEEGLRSLGLRSVGENVRVSDLCRIYDPQLISIESNSRIDDFCFLSGLISIGRNVHVAPYTSIAAGPVGVTMQDFSGLSSGCRIFAQSDDYSGEYLTNPTVPDKYTGVMRAPVTIGRHSILGAGSIVLPGVNLADGTAAGALTLFRHSTEPWGIYVGQPARRVRERSKLLLELERTYLNEI